MARVLIVPGVLYFIDNFSPVRSFIAAVLYLIAATSDGLDGYLARSRGQVSTLGKFLDPLADKLVVTAVLIFLVALGRATAWVVVVLIARDFCITGLRSIASSEGMIISASPGGKIKTALQLVAITMLLIHFSYPVLGLGFSVDYQAAGTVLLGISVAVSLASGVEYVWGFGKAMGAASRESPSDS
ncbi:MAG TPA: CDP-diacylglycerol--glycerol-3-phosphate 3-phosphatidyltransferase [Polyangia bacterium]